MVLFAAEKLLVLPFVVLVPLIPLIVGMLWLVRRLGKSVRHRLLLYLGGLVGAILAGIPLPIWRDEHPWLMSEGVESAVELAAMTLGCFVGVLLMWFVCRILVAKRPSSPSMRLHFTIRDVLWLTLVVAMAVGWWFQSRRAAPRYVVNEFKGLEANVPVLRDTQTGETWIPVGDNWERAYVGLPRANPGQ
jgi:hypothetical protein